MARFFRRVQQRVAAPPGTVEYVGEKQVESVSISLFDYNSERLSERESATVEECAAAVKPDTVTWVNVNGLHEVEVLKKLGAQADLHPLVLEDIVNTNQRAKVEDFTEYLYVVVHMLRYVEDTGRIESEQVSLVLGKHYVLSFQERPGDVFDPVRERIRVGTGRIRKSGADYLAYALLDAAVDGYFLVLDKLGGRIEQLEELLSQDLTAEHRQEIYDMKREVLFVRKSVWPLRETLSRLQRTETKLISKATEIFMRDVYDHVVQVMDAVESYRELTSGLQDLYLSTVSNRMNEVMKVLTIIATIFVPLTFIAGIYGMNFEFMPELGWRWSYAVFWGVIAGVAGVMLSFFRRKRWL